MIDKKNPTLLQMFSTLLVTALVCSAGISLVYKATEQTIKNSRTKKQIELISKVLPAQFDNSPIQECFNYADANGDSLTFYPAKQSGNLIGMAIKSYDKTAYNGLLEVLVGFTPSGVIINTQAATINETPGLGQKADKSVSSWSDQFNDKDPANFKLSVKKDGGQVDAITAATITSRAYSRAIQLAYNTFMAYQNNQKPQAVSGATNNSAH